MTIKQIKIVVGAMFGDEGKGLMTDYFAGRESGASACVVRFNGGAQAGHTVQRAGQRHVFHHFGSGTLAGAHTYLGPKFLVDPAGFREEYEELVVLNAPNRNMISVHPDCRITTIPDILLNQLAERARGDGRHGSCGHGINEAVVRNEHPEFALSMTQAYDCDLREKLRRISLDWFPARAAQLGVKTTSAIYQTLGTANERWLREFDDMANRINLAPVIKLNAYDRVVFEGAQGLGLDERHKFFPHVTRSRTGVANVLPMLDSLTPNEPTELVYVVRFYATRHGAGPLPHEGTRVLATSLEDSTNSPNDFQGTIRTAPLDVRLLRHHLADDYSAGMRRSIALTHCDRMQPMVVIGDEFGQLKTMRSALLPIYLEDALGVPVRYMAAGPSAKDVLTGDEFQTLFRRQA